MSRGFNIDWRKSVIVLSGGFDPVHRGHLRMFREASNLGHQVIVGLNSATVAISTSMSLPKLTVILENAITSMSDSEC